MKTLDITPTWEQVLPALLVLFTDGNSEAKKVAQEELRNMARVADRYVTQAKAAKDSTDQPLAVIPL